MNLENKAKLNPCSLELMPARHKRYMIYGMLRPLTILQPPKQRFPPTRVDVVAANGIVLDLPIFCIVVRTPDLADKLLASAV